MPTNALPTPEVPIADELRRVVKRSHALRTLGLALGGIMVGTVLFLRGTPLPVWGLWALYVLVWPHIVWLLVARSAKPAAADQRWLLVDAAMVGVWIALMQFNLLPSVLLAIMLAMTVVAMGGGPLLLRSGAVLIAACAVTALVDGLAFAPTTGMPELLASMPLLVVFPMAVSVVMHGLAQRVRHQNRTLRELSSIDSLSGLSNRRHWEYMVDALLAGRHREQAVMLLIDIDHFKHVNDRHGHTVGDDVIGVVGSIIRENVREGDLAGRYGGDEFAVVLRDADEEAATRVAERIRSGLACKLINGATGLRCTLSIGAAPGRLEMGDAREWVKAADLALYRAKLAGRNRSAMAVAANGDVC